MKLILLIIIVIINLSFTIIQPTGVVRFYNEDKGFGYIIDNETGDDLFVYEGGLIDEIYGECDSLKNPLKDNDNVKYNVRNTRKGLEAYNVRLR